MRQPEINHISQQLINQKSARTPAMIKIAAFIVIAFFFTLWATGNDLASFKHGLVHWADGNTKMTGSDSDWGN